MHKAHRHWGMVLWFSRCTPFILSLLSSIVVCIVHVCVRAYVHVFGAWCDQRTDCWGCSLLQLCVSQNGIRFSCMDVTIFTHWAVLLALLSFVLTERKFRVLGEDGETLKLKNVIGILLHKPNAKFCLRLSKRKNTIKYPIIKCSVRDSLVGYFILLQWTYLFPMIWSFIIYYTIILLKMVGNVWTILVSGIVRSRKRIECWR